MATCIHPCPGMTHDGTPVPHLWHRGHCTGPEPVSSPRKPNLRYLCLAFLEADDDAVAWGSGDRDDFADAADCDVMAARFADFAEARGFAATAVQVNVLAAHDTMTDIHWFTVIDGVAIDWTARQFYNVDGVNLDPSEIPSPLLFLYPGPYPLPTITIEEV